MSGVDHSLYASGGKRILDTLVAGTLLVVLSPIIVLVGIAVAARLGRPILFLHQRAGLSGRPFTLVKFRTMANAARATDGSAATDAARLSAFGHRLRATSLDELPQLLNVLRGDMSLVGPRPLLPEYLPRYNATQARRHEVLPGITGLAQVSGRNGLSWEEKFALDVSYVDSVCLALDVRILVATVHQVIARRGITETGQATAREFLGTKVS